VSRRAFLLSPARLDGERARVLFNPSTPFPAAAALRSREGAELGLVMSFLSGLYFRGKLGYANAFASPEHVLVITTNRGLLPARTRIKVDDLARFAETDIHHRSEAFIGPLARDAAALGKKLGNDGEAVLLGSIATAKYVDPLLAAFGERLLFPSEFVGRGDMSRGGLLLRCVDARTELTYVPVRGAKRHGERPPKLAPRRRWPTRRVRNHHD
jgi:hypothetical protein